MAFTLSAAAIADGCIFCLAVDEDGVTIKEFANPTVNSTKVVDANVTIGSKNWKGTLRSYFETIADGDFGFDGITWAAGDGRLFSIANPAGITLGVISAGISAGANGTFFISFQEDQLGFRVTAGKGQINFGGGGASTTTTIPLDGTSFHVSGNYDGFTGGNSEIGFGLESSTFANEATVTQGEFGGNNRLTGIGGTPGNGNQPGKYHIIYGYSTETSEALKQTIHTEPWDYFFEEAIPPDPASVTDAQFAVSGGSSNYSMDGCLGGAVGPRDILPLSGYPNCLFPPITAAQAAAGRTDYLCLYIQNPELGPMEEVELYITASPANATMTIGLDPAGVGGTAVTIANTTTAPVGVTFSAPSSGSPLVIGDIPGGDGQAFWIRRVTTGGADPSTNERIILQIRDVDDDILSINLRHFVLEDEARVWSEIAATNLMSAVDPCPGNLCDYSGSGGQASIAFAWGSMALRLQPGLIQALRIGGGHGDYGGNEVYAFTYYLGGNFVGTWTRLTTPSTPTGGSEASGKYGDGLPRSVHSGHSAVLYDKFNDALFLPVMASQYINAGGSTQAFAFDPDTSTWDLTLPAGGPANPNGGGVGGSDNNRTCFIEGLNEISFEPNLSRGNWAKWNCSTQTWGDYIGGSDVDSNTELMVYDYRRHLVYGFGTQASAEISIWDYGPANSPPRKQTTTGDTAITASTTLGAIYDWARDRVRLWDGGSDFVELNLDTYVLADLTPDAGDVPPAAEANGTFKQFDYIPPSTEFTQGAYLLLTDTTTDPFVFSQVDEPVPPEEEGGMEGSMEGNIEGQSIEVV